MDQNLSEGIERLSQKPSVNEIDHFLKSWHNASAELSAVQSQKLKLIINLLNFTIPEIYHSLSKSSRHHVEEIFSSVIGIGNLTTRIQLIADRSNLEVLKSLVDILKNVFHHGVVTQLIESQGSKFYMKEVEKLIFKGKVFSIISEVIFKVPDLKDYCGLFKSTLSYNGFLIDEIIALIKNGLGYCDISSIVLSFLAFNSTASIQFLETLFTRDNFDSLIYIFNSFKPFDKREFLYKYLLPFITKKYLSNEPERERVVALSYSLTGFEFGSLSSDTIINKVIALNNYNLNVLFSSFFRETKSIPVLEGLIRRLLLQWGDINQIKSVPVSIQKNETHLLILLTSYATKSFAKTLLSDSKFLESISGRLESFSSNVKQLGIVFANKVCEFAGEKQIFDMEVDNYISYLQNCNRIDYDNSEFSDSLDEIWNILEKSVPVIEDIEEGEKESPNQVVNIDKKMGFMSINSDEESDSDDDPTVSRHLKPPTPVYIKDLITYLTTDSKDQQAYDKRRIALNNGPTLIRQKASFGGELQLNSTELARVFIGLKNNFEDEDFESLKLNCLVALVSSFPKVSFDLVDLLSNGDYSLQQRICILSCLSLGARELKGFKDNVVINSYEERSFPTQRLPEHLHNQFIIMENQKLNLKTLDYGLNDITKAVQKHLLHETSEQSKDILSKGQILRISRKLTKQNASSQMPQIVNKDYPKIVGSIFFYPLVNLWHQVGSISIGHYSPLLVAHYVKTLALILHTAYPTSPDLQDMIKEIIIIVTPLKNQTETDQIPVIESIVTSLLLVIDIADGGFLMTNYGRELMEHKNWLTNNWEMIIDDNVKGLAAGLLIQLSELVEKYERLLLDEMSSGFYD